MFASIPRWLRIVVYTQIALVFAIPTGGWILQRAGEAADLRKFPPPGKTVDLGGRRLHLDCSGEANGLPVVVFQADLGDHGLVWRGVQKALQGQRRSCAIDRAGLGWSDPGPDDRSIPASAREVRAVLQASGEPGPFVLVGHGLGALHLLALAHENPDLAAALILVDPLPPDCLKDRLDAIAALAEPAHQDAIRAKLQEVIAERGACPEGEGGTPLLGWLARIGMVRALAGRNFDATCPLPELLDVHRALKLRTQATDALLQESKTAYVGMSAIPDAVRALPPVPVRVLSRGRLGNFVVDQDFLERRGDEVTLAFERAQLRYLQDRHRQLAEATHGQHLVASASGHYILVSEPGQIAELIRTLPPSSPAVPGR